LNFLCRLKIMRPSDPGPDISATQNRLVDTTNSGRIFKNQPVKTRLAKTDKKRRDLNSGLIPYELLLTGRRLHRSGSPRTCPCRLLPFRYPWQLPMRDIHSRRFHIRYTYLCQRLLPTRSLQRICFGEKKKRVSIMTRSRRERGTEKMRQHLRL